MNGWLLGGMSHNTDATERSSSRSSNSICVNHNRGWYFPYAVTIKTFCNPCFCPGEIVKEEMGEPPRQLVPRLLLNLDGRLDSLALLLGALVRLVTHDATTPGAACSLGVDHVSILDGGHQLGQLRLVLGADFSDGQDSSGLKNTINVNGGSA